MRDQRQLKADDLPVIRATVAAWLLGCSPDKEPPQHDNLEPSTDDTVAECSSPTPVTLDTGDTATVSPDTGVDVPLTWVEADVGLSFTMSCGLVSDGTVRCWGTPECVSRAPDSTELFSQVSVGGSEACGIRLDGTVSCWCCAADYGFGEICTEAPEGQYTRVLVGAHSACAQDLAGIVTCWGYDAIAGTPPAAPVLDFAMDANYTAAVLEDGSITWWGDFTLWGPGEKPPDGVVFTDISIGRRHACGLDVTGTAHCWGDDTELEPFPDPPAGTFGQVESYNNVSCVIDLAGAPTCWWGSSIDFFELWTFQLPTAPLAQIGIGEWAGCGVDTAGNAYCWGGDPATQSWLDVPNLNP